MKRVIFLILLIIPVNMAHAAQLDALILNSQNTIEPSFKFLRVVYIEYPEGGRLKDILDRKSSEISFTVDSEDPGVKKIIAQINEDLKNSKSKASVDDLTIQYHATLSSNPKSASIEYDIKMNPVISGHIISKDLQVFVDSKWRGFKVKEPIMVDTKFGEFDINNPSSALNVLIPQVATELENTQAKQVLEIPLIDASGLNQLPLSKWHFLFDPTGQQIESKNIGYKEKGIFSRFSMGECNISTGVCNDKEWKAEFVTDKKYAIRAVESQDDGTLAIQGYVNVKSLDGIEVFEVNPKGESTDERIRQFPAGVIYGMVILAVIGAVVFFIFSNRQLKKDTGAGQTGIDPALLHVQETSNSAGSYKTNRGEAYLPEPIKENTTKSPVRG